MAEEQDVLNKDPNEIRQEIDETRSALTEKLETLEETVKETIVDTKDSVTETIATVKETVQDTVQSVKRTFDLKYQTERHPWGMFAGSFAAGFVVGRVAMPRHLHDGHHTARHEPVASAFSPAQPSYQESNAGYQAGDRSFTDLPRSAGAAESQGPGVMSKMADQFEDEIRQIKELAIGTLFGLLRDVVKQAVLPTLAPQVEKIVDGLTTKLGGKPIEGPIMDMNRSEHDRPHEASPHTSGYANPGI